MPRILFQKDGVVVVDKPPGLPSTGRTLSDPHCVQAWLMTTLQRRKVWAVHQLDADTSGINVFVTKKPLVQTWSEHLRRGSKNYLAVVHGTWDHGEVTVNQPIRTGRVPSLSSDGKTATTMFFPVSVGHHTSLIRAKLATGRTHQVRLHLKHLGHPLIGEKLHRDPPCTSHHRHALHAWRLKAGDQDWECKPPEDFVELVRSLGIPTDL